MRDELIHYMAEALAERADDYEEAAVWVSSLVEAERDAVLTSFWPREHGHELGLAPCWRDVDLAAGWLHVGEAKTDADRRREKIRGALRDELAGVRAHAGRVDPDGYVFATSTGRRPGRENIRNCVLAPAVELASASPRRP